MIRFKLNEIEKSLERTGGTPRVIRSQIITGETYQECFEVVQELEYRGRFDRFRYYDFANKQIKRAYLDWKCTGITPDMF